MENMTAILNTAFRGFVDSLKGTIVIFYLDKNIKERAGLATSSPMKEPHSPARRKEINRETSKVVRPSNRHEEPKVLTRTLQCCLLNGGVFWLSILFFEYGLLPSLKYFLTVIFGHSSGTGKSVWSWMRLCLSWTFGAIWVLPLFLLSKIVNSLWFQDIADSAYRYSRGRPQLLPSVSKLIADSLFSVLVQALFLVQGMLVSMVPIAYLGELLCLVHMCMLYSLYAFEYKWFNMGWELHRRLTFIEHNWPYFIGFGFPLAVLTAWPSSYIVSGCVFSILFPLFIISGNEAEPITGSCFSKFVSRPRRMIIPSCCQTSRVERGVILFRRLLGCRTHFKSARPILQTPLTTREILKGIQDHWVFQTKEFCTPANSLYQVNVKILLDLLNEHEMTTVR